MVIGRCVLKLPSDSRHGGQVNRGKTESDLYNEKVERLVRVVEKIRREFHATHGHLMKVRIENCEHPDCKEMREALE